MGTRCCYMSECIFYVIKRKKERERKKLVCV